MILGFDKTPGASEDTKLQSLMESVQLALNEVTDNLGGLRDEIRSKATLSACLDTFYPVGSYYETSDTSFDPNVSFGGTWSLVTAGRWHRTA